jgi:hypothetical protein
MIGSGYVSGMTDTSGVSGMSGITSMGLQPIGLREEGKFIPAPSPLASSFTAPTPREEGNGRFAQAQRSPLRSNVHTATPDAEIKRPNTVYNPDDAYGGF